jgi:hypothetical protein
MSSVPTHQQNSRVVSGRVASRVVSSITSPIQNLNCVRPSPVAYSYTHASRRQPSVNRNVEPSALPRKWSPSRQYSVRWLGLVAAPRVSFDAMPTYWLWHRQGCPLTLQTAPLVTGVLCRPRATPKAQARPPSRSSGEPISPASRPAGGEQKTHIAAQSETGWQQYLSVGNSGHTYLDVVVAAQPRGGQNPTPCMSPALAAHGHSAAPAKR